MRSWIMLACIVMFGCGTYAKMESEFWRGGTEQQFYADRIKCQKVARYRVLLFVITSGEDWETCMRAAGWTPTYRD